ncbi:hypothetical protein GCM10017744_064630 [Streptomyces antimycoticus]
MATDGEGAARRVIGGHDHQTAAVTDEGAADPAVGRLGDGLRVAAPHRHKVRDADTQGVAPPFRGSVRLRGAPASPSYRWEVPPVDGRPCSVDRSSLPARALPYDSDAPLRLAPGYRWEVPPAG